MSEVQEIGMAWLGYLKAIEENDRPGEAWSRVVKLLNKAALNAGKAALEGAANV